MAARARASRATAGATRTVRRCTFLTDDEVKNLTIRAGTLTATSARSSTTTSCYDPDARGAALAEAPRHVPEYAGGHHERMDGKGYPKGLTREQMSVQARCMGIADIFEALTAKDRPYKKGKTLSEVARRSSAASRRTATSIPDLFDVFMWEKVYDTYTREFLPPEQIDPVGSCVHSRLRDSSAGPELTRRRCY